MRYFSMFSGIGGFELGILYAHGSPNGRGEVNQAPVSEAGRGSFPAPGQDPDTPDGRPLPSPGDEPDERPLCVGYSEIDQYAIKTYEEHFSGHRNYGDATTINPRELPDFELLVGGFPCQAFSVAGRRAGFDDTRGTLFFDIARILEHKRPRHLVLENVKGLLSHDSGKTFQVILGVLANLGYRVEWQVLNSKDFGVPQNRERIYIIGHLRGECGAQVLPLAGADGEDPRPDHGAVGVNNPSRGFEARRDGLASTVRAGESGTKNIIKVVTPHIRYGAGSRKTHQTLEDTVPTIRATHHKAGDNQPVILHNVYGGFGETKPREFRGVSPTIRTPQGGGHLPILKSGARVRRLTPIECERLQGFPDYWTLGSDTQRYKQCGNAVTVNVVAAVMEALV